jgi:transposase
MQKTYLPYDQDQLLLLPPSVREWVEPGDLAHLIDDVVECLELSAIEAVYEAELRGAPPYHPAMMTKLWLYAYAVGVTSSRRLAKLVQRDVGVMMLGAGNRPDFRTLNSFRQRHLKELAGLFKQVLKLCRRKGLLEMKHVAIDGTKLRANASKHTAMSYGRMKDEDERIGKEIEAWFREADRVDAAEDRAYGEEQGDELPPELQNVERRRQAIKEAMAELKKEAEAQGREEPLAKAQRNFTDSESRIMRSGEGAFIQGYNGQAAVDAKHQIIVAADLNNQAADSVQLIPMVDLVRGNLGRNPKQISADAGYCSEANLKVLEQRRLDPYIATGKRSRDRNLPPAPKGRIPVHLTTRQRMERKLLTKAGRAAYRLRQQVVEPVFGQIKNKGLIRLLLRGEEHCRAEWLLHCTGHNLCKLQAVWG